jgi:hypothetical protein
MRIPTPIGFVAIAALVGASLAPAASMVRPPLHQAVSVHHVAGGTSVAHRGLIAQLRHVAIPAKAGKGDVYVSDAGENLINGYAPAGGNPVFTVSAGLSQPQGMASTKKSIYVANTNDSQIIQYTPPSTTATATITDSGFFPAGVAVDKKGKTVWASNICSAPSCGMGNIEEFNGSNGSLIQAITCSNMFRYYFIGMNKAGDVAVSGEDASGFPVIDYVTNGSSTCNATSISVEFPGGVEFDTKGNLAVLDQDAATISVYGGTGYGTLVSTTSLGGASDPVTFGFAKKDATAWTANAGGFAAGYAYPAGGNPTVTITSGLLEPIGVAVTPPGKAG